MPDLPPSQSKSTVEQFIDMERADQASILIQLTSLNDGYGDYPSYGVVPYRCTSYVLQLSAMLLVFIGNARLESGQGQAETWTSRDQTEVTESFFPSGGFHAKRTRVTSLFSGCTKRFRQRPGDGHIQTGLLFVLLSSPFLAAMAEKPCLEASRKMLTSLYYDAGRPQRTRAKDELVQVKKHSEYEVGTLYAQGSGHWCVTPPVRRSLTVVANENRRSVVNDARFCLMRDTLKRQTYPALARLLYE
ncbi:hypothetical protein ACRALDRAFT_2045353 [Sodiomyces alcalophilus JCM 7366]|uniref:uncharacterized protein n=1 Tax=Sodiomyces alcalophilus JCM 7366 TaxID=591952 RepID=UPI0039B64EB2